jgi:hypothetical protein
MKKIIAVIYCVVFLSSILLSQSITTVIFPQFIQGNTGTNSNRIPFAYSARITGLTANATYRYFNQVVISTDGAGSNGAGNCIYVSNTGDFIRTSNPGISTAGNYGTFTTNTSGEYEGWFITEPTASATRFIPGRYVFVRINLNNGAEGTTVAVRVTTADSVRVIKLDPVSSDSTGTGLRCTSTGSPKDFVFLYDNTTGTGRPISGTFIESDGTDNATNYSAFYVNNVDGINGAFGVVLPNILPNGIRRVEQYSLSNGAPITATNDSDGIWPSGANTVNPSGGATEIVLTSSDVLLITGVTDFKNHPGEFALYQNNPNPFNPATKIGYRLQTAGHIKLSVYNVIGQEIAVLVNEEEPAGMHTVIWNANNIPSGVYFARLQSKTDIIVKKMLLTK